MTREELYEIWAPASGRWSPWAKPVLFAHADATYADNTTGEFQAPGELIDLTWAPPGDGRSAFVLDLPSLLGTYGGLALAQRGYRPVPLYNSAPAPGGVAAAIDVTPILQTLIAGASLLAQINLPEDAPPAFLLDAERRYGAGVGLESGMYDNRSVSLPTDFPSANTLLAAGIDTVILVQEQSVAPQADLSHTMLRWQQAGMHIRAKALNDPRGVIDIAVQKPPLFRVAWQRLLATIGLRRNPLGGFGGFLPDPSSSG